ncbi:uncharacterized protein ASCRUDRAFT_75749 [Ascoidea rubescens DSM 1968]|uniref:Uncharacterized protein n=1 Tax=Ascoidea rubescens DSM 1968 TaxID=1344418 RepID=A0A1D2VHC2_9ASCO|nr:hypothetical protein ASCRUDRAFT_75749 [Ascoidea rubescens DSM 1968]ODV60999.1 hypothetical protein ASCRUDRAFT_75749 [Ascoidea rubescens DSM 1968]
MGVSLPFAVNDKDNTSALFSDSTSIKHAGKDNLYTDSSLDDKEANGVGHIKLNSSNFAAFHEGNNLIADAITGGTPIADELAGTKNLSSVCEWHRIRVQLVNKCLIDSISGRTPLI